MANVNYDGMGALFNVAADEQIGEEALAAPAGPEDKFVPVGADAPGHRLVGNIDVQGPAIESFPETEAYRRNGAAIVGLDIEETGGLLSKSIKGLVHGQVGSVARHPSPKELRRADGFLSGMRIHLGKGRREDVFHFFGLYRIIGPCEHIKMGLDRETLVTDGFVKEIIGGIAADSILPRIGG